MIARSVVHEFVEMREFIGHPRFTQGLPLNVGQVIRLKVPARCHGTKPLVFVKVRRLFAGAFVFFIENGCRVSHDLNLGFLPEKIEPAGVPANK